MPFQFLLERDPAIMGDEWVRRMEPAVRLSIWQTHLSHSSFLTLLSHGLEGQVESHLGHSLLQCWEACNALRHLADTDLRFMRSGPCQKGHGCAVSNSGDWEGKGRGQCLSMRANAKRPQGMPSVGLACFGVVVSLAGFVFMHG